MSEDPRLDGALRAALRTTPGPGTPCAGDEDLAALAAGTLGGAAAEALRDHVADCRACGARLRDAHRFVRALSEPPRRRLRAWAYAAAAVLAGTALLLAFRTSGPEGIDLPLVAAPYPPPPADILWRGGGEPGTDPLDAAMESYVQGDYPRAAASLESYLRSHPGDDRGLFYLGVSHLLAGAPGRAVPPLRAAADGGGERAEEASWYLALALLRDGRPAEARPRLEALAAQGGETGERARRLLRDLGP